ncbi:MAG TPA: curli-like amyloid fiber formation chaperone CsgH [Burkholderiales bacterium]|nr:curli-like amyloid fiber formation chaperone CsgH [Burkholderiales bacterium]
MLSSTALADAPGYDLSLGAEARDGTLKVAPVVTAPAGANLRYDVITTRTGRSGNSNSRQSGNVTVGDDGKASLSQVALSVRAQDRYEVHVDVYDGKRLVASQTLKHP